nr:hypothetical protein [Clostridium cavendishii]
MPQPIVFKIRSSTSDTLLRNGSWTISIVNEAKKNYHYINNFFITFILPEMRNNKDLILGEFFN